MIYITVDLKSCCGQSMLQVIASTTVRISMKGIGICNKKYEGLALFRHCCLHVLWKMEQKDETGSVVGLPWKGDE